MASMIPLSKPSSSHNQYRRRRRSYDHCCQGLLKVSMLLFVVMVTLLPSCRADGEGSGWLSSIVSGYSSFETQFKSMSCTALGVKCCEDTPAARQAAIPSLRKVLEDRFFGQHIALETVIRALDIHVRNPAPEKSLVLSFHGCVGSGKSYLARHIINSLFGKGMDSKNVKLIYTPAIDLSDSTKVKEYKERLQDEIMTTLKNCPHSIIVFDQLANTQLEKEVLQAIAPFLGYPAHKNAIFIFISNTASNGINAIALQALADGRAREDLTYKDFEHNIKFHLSNQEDFGLYRNYLIELIDYFIPFLPMESKHVRQCIALEARRHLGNRIDHEKVANYVEYWPEDLQLFSKSGCKRLEAAVKYEHEEELQSSNRNPAETDHKPSGGMNTPDTDDEVYNVPGPDGLKTETAETEQGGSWKRAALVGAGVVVGTAGAIAATPVVLTAAGFSGAGIVAGSVAAGIQSAVYGGAAGGVFAALQSAGAAGVAATTQAIIGAAGGSVVGIFANYFSSNSTS